MPAQSFSNNLSIKAYKLPIGTAFAHKDYAMRILRENRFCTDHDCETMIKKYKPIIPENSQKLILASSAIPGKPRPIIHLGRLLLICNLHWCHSLP